MRLYFYECVYFYDDTSLTLTLTHLGIIVDNNLSVYEIIENESLFHDTTRQWSGVE